MAEPNWNQAPESVKTILVTGGAGFIGSNFLNLAVPRFPAIRFINADALTYAGNLRNLGPIDRCSNYAFQRLDISDEEAVRRLFEATRPDWVVHFAAETHVDRSIVDPIGFTKSNVIGTVNLLDAARRLWGSFEGKLFHHISTDEVYGSLGEEGLFHETTAYDPSSPYSASKAGSDHLVKAFGHTYGMPVKITNCSNNYGPYQFPEKLIPFMTLSALDGKPLPVYGTGQNIRDWLFVGDHCEAIWTVATSGREGETYNVGGNSERTNLDVVKGICAAVAIETGKDVAELEASIQFVGDRPGHDFRYGVDTQKIQEELGWTPRETFETGLNKTVQWYLSNPAWIEEVRSGSYRDWIEANYAAR